MNSEKRRFNVLNCGRREGKTDEAERQLTETALAGLPAAYLCPTYKMLTQVWRDLVELLPMARKLVAEYRLELPGGGSIDMWSGDDAANAIRGRKYAKIVVDEAALIPGLQEAWERSIRPTLTDLRGEAWFMSTPRRGGTFEVLFERGQGDDPEWKSWKMPTSMNPFIDPAEIEAARGSMSEQAFAQEYEADFEASESDLVYPEASMVLHGRASIPVEPAQWLAHIVGIDPGGGDPTAIVPIAVWRDESPTVARSLPTLRFHQHDEFYRRGDVSDEDVILYLKKMQAIHPLTKVLVAETGGNIITNTLLRAGIPAERYVKERGGGIETVRWLLQAQRLSIAPACTNSWAEFSGYRWKKVRDMETGERYATSTAGDNHADAMDARRAALQWTVDAYTNGQNLQRQSTVKQTWGAPKAKQVWG